jgi:hypothetical protein
LKIILARKIIAKVCQIVKLTPNQDRIKPSNYASKRSPATTRTITPKVIPIAVVVFIINFQSCDRVFLQVFSTDFHILYSVDVKHS